MFIEVNGLNTQYQKIGHGPALVMLHGWGCDWQIWAPLIPRLSDSFTLIIPDLPAFGRSATPDTVWSSQEYLTWLTAFIEQVLPNTEFALMGHSFGGKIAALYASTKPALLKKLILTDASGIPDPLSWKRQIQKQTLALIPERVKAAIPLSLKTRFLTATASATDHFHSTPDQRAILKKIVREDITSQLTSISTPTLLCWGTNDPDTPLHQGEKFQSLIEGSQLVVFEHSGHFPFIEETDTFMITCTDFLKF